MASNGINLQLVCSLVGFSQCLSVSQQCFPLTINQHQPGLSAQKPTSEQTEYCCQAKHIVIIMPSYGTFTCTLYLPAVLNIFSFLITPYDTMHLAGVELVTVSSLLA